MKPYGQTLGDKTVDCLRLCALRLGTAPRRAMEDALAQKYSWKAIVATIERHGDLFEWGVSASSAWLTEEGNSALADVDPSHESMRGRYGLLEFDEEAPPV